ncbi:hypothetical protein [Parendozoicomonas haliclonae]|uniref:Uncharacterized protein n=1 Tax=Parendozoicomonas haliclonae TaxID=1960125 RepID=A0A1X7ALW1_9GAMM|nr:hypothetical protein [Parendozoicomonas haliclonae]SMA48652.1 hypothetical protein EHSB41UT_02831 [Parendozoicomonas haliclonae]
MNAQIRPRRALRSSNPLPPTGTEPSTGKGKGRAKVSKRDTSTAQIPAGPSRSGNTSTRQRRVNLPPKNDGWLRPGTIGQTFMQLPNNFGGKTCGISAGQAFLSFAVSDQLLGEIKERECPEELLTDRAADEIPALQDSWERLRDSFVDYQLALRCPEETEDEGEESPLDAKLIELIEASYVFHQISGDHRLADVLPFEVDVDNSRQSGFLSNEVLNKIQQGDVEEFMEFLLNSMGMLQGGTRWSNFLEVEWGHRYELGIAGGEPVYLDKPFAVPLPDYWIEIPFATKAGEYRPTSLQDYIGSRVYQLPGEPMNFDNGDESLARTTIENEIQGLSRRRLGAQKKRQVTRELEALKVKEWNGACVPHASLVRLRIGENNDGLCIRLNVGKSSGEQEKSSFDNGELTAADTERPELNISPVVTGKELFKEYYCHEERESRKDEDGASVGTTDKIYFVSQAMPQEQGAACQLSQAIYEMFGMQVARLTPIRRREKSSKRVSLNPDGRVMHAMDVLPEPADYTKVAVNQAIRNGVSNQEAVVVDALLGNLDVASSRLAVMEQVVDAAGQTGNVLYRTDFSGCMGYNREKGYQKHANGFDRNRFGLDASKDLLKLKREMNASDESLRKGMALLSQLTDSDICALVAYHLSKYKTGSQSSQQDQEQVVRTLISRRDSLLKMAQFKPTAQDLDEAHKIAFSSRNKSHHEVASALAGSDGRFELPEVYNLGQGSVYQGQITAMVCQVGDTSRSGHLITLFEYGGEWMVADDLCKSHEAVLLSDYLDDTVKGHLVDQNAPNGWGTLANMLTKDMKLVTPSLLFVRRVGEQCRPELEPEFMRGRMQSWLDNNAPDSSDDQVEAMDEERPGASDPQSSETDEIFIVEDPGSEEEMELVVLETRKRGRGFQKPAHPKAVKKVKLEPVVVSSDEDDTQADDESEDEPQPKAVKKKKTHSTRKRAVSPERSSSEESASFDDEEPVKKKTSIKTKKVHKRKLRRSTIKEQTKPVIRRKHF